MRVLAKVRSSLGVPVLTDVHTEAQVAAAAEAVDILQIPAFLCRQTDLILAAVRTGRIVQTVLAPLLARLGSDAQRRYWRERYFDARP